ncbi:hypothetical protein [Streptomyces antnestii]|uniref:hypothetical protein n=1 Tax=Streptomyces antnestii TaxID=2494256 RepID=UPI00167467BA|nr:hypothetical protein [Streptomyces sp. San01]
MADRRPTHADVPDESAIPTPASPTRIRLVTTGIVLGLASITVVPAVLAAPLADPAPI